MFDRLADTNASDRLAEVILGAYAGDDQLRAVLAGEDAHLPCRNDSADAIVGWSAATTKHTTLVLDALDMGLWRRDRDGRPVEAGLIRHSDAGSRANSTGRRNSSNPIESENGTAYRVA